MHRSSLYLQLVFNLKMWFIIHKHGEMFYNFRIFSLLSFLREDFQSSGWRLRHWSIEFIPRKVMCKNNLLWCYCDTVVFFLWNCHLFMLCQFDVRYTSFPSLHVISLLLVFQPDVTSLRFNWWFSSCTLYDVFDPEKLTLDTSAI